MHACACTFWHDIFTSTTIMASSSLDLEALEDEFSLDGMWFPARVRELFEKAEETSLQNQREEALQKEHDLEANLRKDLEVI
jgi:hypothetical protein